jgi:hypothetical protein
MSKKVIYIKENTIGSMLADTFTFATICLSFWFNYKFIGGNDALDALLFICFILFAIGKASQLKKLAEIEKNEL